MILTGTTDMPIVADVRGVVMENGGNEEVLLSSSGVRVDERHYLWCDILGIKLLPPSRRRVIGRLASIAVNSVLGNVWAGGVEPLGCRLGIALKSGLITAQIHPNRTDRKDFKQLLSWVDGRLKKGESLEPLESGVALWRDIS